MADRLEASAERARPSRKIAVANRAAATLFATASLSRPEDGRVEPKNMKVM